MDAIVAIDTEQRIVLFNPAAEALFGYVTADALGMPLDRLLPNRYVDLHRQHVATFMSTGETSRAMGHLRPLVARRADGHEFPIEATISEVTIEGRTYGAAIVRDISERHAAEAERATVLAHEAAAQAEAAAAAIERDRMRHILDGLPAGVEIQTPPDGDDRFCQCGILGHGVWSNHRHPMSDRLYGRDFTFLRADGVFLPSSERPGLRALRGEHVRGQQLLLKRANGQILPISADAAPLAGESGSIEQALVVIQDVTALRQAEQLKDDFLALISHEFRTPLTAIHGGAHLLARASGTLDDAGRQELLTDIVTESERLDRMLSNILTLANVLGGRLQVATEPVLAAPLVRRVTADMSVRNPGHQFIVDVPNDLSPLEADPDLLEQVLRNLYENALKYAPGGGRIHTTADEADEVVTLSVTDEGSGIAPEALSTVFERFRRVGGDPTVRGMGLGLYLSRHLIEAQNGRISVTSPGLGKGTTFTVTLPTAAGWKDEHSMTESKGFS